MVSLCQCDSVQYQSRYCAACGGFRLPYNSKNDIFTTYHFDKKMGKPNNRIEIQPRDKNLTYSIISFLHCDDYVAVELQNERKEKRIQLYFLQDINLTGISATAKLEILADYKYFCLLRPYLLTLNSHNLLTFYHFEDKSKNKEINLKKYISNNQHVIALFSIDDYSEEVIKSQLLIVTNNSIYQVFLTKYFELEDVKEIKEINLQGKSIYTLNDYKQKLLNFIINSDKQVIQFDYQNSKFLNPKEIKINGNELVLQLTFNNYDFQIYKDYNNIKVELKSNLTDFSLNTNTEIQKISKPIIDDKKILFFIEDDVDVKLCYFNFEDKQWKIDTKFNQKLQNNNIEPNTFIDNIKLDNTNLSELPSTYFIINEDLYFLATKLNQNNLFKYNFGNNQIIQSYEKIPKGNIILTYSYLVILTVNSIYTNQRPI